MKSPRRHRPLVVLVTLGAVIATGLALLAGPAAAKDARTEISKKVVVAGKALESSDLIASTDDPAIGKVAPKITGQGFDGRKVSIGGPGKPRIVVFAAHWCPHCQREVPRIVKLAEQGKLDGVEVDTVTTGTDSNADNYPPSKWLSREEWPFKTVLADDADQRALIAYGGTAYPFFVFLDANGKVVGRASGELEPRTIAAAAKNLAAGKSVFASS
jgi:thiol-disulfide isomerase/thioredoxin